MNSPVVHRSRIGLEILIPILVVFGVLITFMILHVIWLGTITCTLVTLFLVNIYTQTYYTITIDDRLVVKCGILETFEINIHDIEWVRKTTELTNAPALSIQRLEISYKGGRILVSPKDREKFVADLRKINPHI